MALNLVSLPTEIHLHLLDKLPARDVQKLRGVCKDLRKVVDTNKVKIANVKMEQERKRVFDYVNYYVFYTDNPTYMEKLSRFCELRGAWRCRACYELIGKLIVRHALRVFGARDHVSFAEWLAISKGLAAAHDASRLRDSPGMDRSKILHYLKVSFVGYQVEADELEQICDEVMVEAAGLFLLEVHADNEHYTTSQPNFPLSGLEIVNHTSERGSGEQKIIPGACNPSELSEWFGLPALPDSTFAYCLKSRVLYERLQSALEHTRNLPLLPDPMFKAAVMEDTFVF